MPRLDLIEDKKSVSLLELPLGPGRDDSPQFCKLTLHRGVGTLQNQQVWPVLRQKTGEALSNPGILAPLWVWKWYRVPYRPRFGG